MANDLGYPPTLGAWQKLQTDLAAVRAELEAVKAERDELAETLKWARWLIREKSEDKNQGVDYDEPEKIPAEIRAALEER